MLVAVGDFGEGTEFLSQFGGQGVFGAAPAPVSCGARGDVHAGFAAEGEDVLTGRGQVGDGRRGGADQRPDDIFVGSSRMSQVGAWPRLSTRRCAMLPPAEGGVVVVGAGVDDGVRLT